MALFLQFFSPHNKEAEPLFQRALEIYIKIYGNEHIETADAISNLACFYHDQHHHASAEPLHRRALAIAEITLGADHPDTATYLFNLAGLLSEDLQYGEAETLYQRALAISEKALGTEHQDTVDIRNGLNWMLKEIVNGDQFDLHTNCACMIDLAIGSDSTPLVTAEIAKKQLNDLLDCIRNGKVFDHMVGFSLGKLGNGCPRIVIAFDESKIPMDIDLAKAIGCEHVEPVQTGTANFFTFNTENKNRVQLGALDDPYAAFQEVLDELMDCMAKNNLDFMECPLFDYTVWYQS